MVKAMEVQSSQSVPRLTVWMVGYIMSLRGQGESYQDIADNPQVRKADGSTLSKQGAWSCGVHGTSSPQAS